MASERVQQFIDNLTPSAIEIGERYGLDPRLIMAQSALETGWGRSVSGNNYFGVKSHGRPGGQQVSTHEEINGQMVPVTDSFRTYNGVTDSMEDYAKFLKGNPRYRSVFEQEALQDQIDAVARAGYATDSRYGPKLTAVANMIPPISASRPPPVMPAPTIMRPPPRANPGGGWLSSFVGGGVNSAVDAIKSQSQTIMRGAQANVQAAAPTIMRAALSTVPGRTAIIDGALKQVFAGDRSSPLDGQQIMTANSGVQTVGQRVNNSSQGYHVSGDSWANAVRGL